MAKRFELDLALRYVLARLSTIPFEPTMWGIRQCVAP